jgi:hypothetical protein
LKQIFKMLFVDYRNSERGSRGNMKLLLSLMAQYFFDPLP